MPRKARYYEVTWNGYVKYIKTTDSWCEVLQMDNGKLRCWNFEAPYPNNGDEEIIEITAQKYNRIRAKLVV